MGFKCQSAKVFGGVGSLFLNFFPRLGHSITGEESVLKKGYREWWGNGHWPRDSDRLVADILIEGFAQRFQGIITRTPKHFSSLATIVP
jgi:hypothetical protein